MNKTPPLVVHFVGYLAPTGRLLVIDDASLARECAVGPSGEGSLRHHEPGASSLGIVLLV